jgi:hypothetical protein
MAQLVAFTACGSVDWERFIEKGVSNLLGRLFHADGTVVTGVRDMVEKLTLKIGPTGAIESLCILDHGEVPADASNWIQLGRDYIYEDKIKAGAAPPEWQTLSALKGSFSDDGFVFLMNCGAGQSPGIMTWIARTVGVRVYGGTGYEHAPGFNDGYYVLAWPDGTVKHRVRRPKASLVSDILDNDPATAPVVG